MAKTTKKPDNGESEGLSFEQALARLETIVDQLEGGETTLESALALFEEGMKLRHLCTEKLEHAEQLMTKLIEASDGSIQEVAFDEGD